MASSSAGTQLVEHFTSRGFELRETHISWVFLGSNEVWKVKKPVDFGFLDFTTLELRRRACEAEVELNRRLAPEVYLGVVPLISDPGGSLRFGDVGETAAEVADWAVHMRRLDDRQRADRRLEVGTLEPEHLEQLAKTLARFHRDADPGDAGAGGLGDVRRNVEENFAQTRGVLEEYLGSQATEVVDWQRDFLDRHGELFEARQATGRIRDGHGDLRLDHVYFEDSDPKTEAPETASCTVLDCIEFNQRFRVADVCADVAFLAMDLQARGRADLSEVFLAAYAREAGDYDLYPLVDFYESYRAFVRGKIATFVTRDASVEYRLRRRAAADARRFFLLALASERRSVVPPAVVAVGGVIASGKSTLAKALSRALVAPVIDADHTRKELSGVEALTPLPDAPWQGSYSEGQTARVYDEVLRRGDAVLRSGRSLVLDASFRCREHRLAARALARRHGVPFRLVECRPPLEVCRWRLEERARHPGVSDGRLEIFDAFVSRWQPVTVDELDDGEHLALDTREPIEANLARVVRGLPVWPERS